MNKKINSERYEMAERELYFWQHSRGRSTNFHSMLYALIAKADIRNKARLALAFPEECEAYYNWVTTGDYEMNFLKKAGGSND